MFTSLYSKFDAFLFGIGETSRLATETFKSVLHGRVRWRLVLQQILDVGYFSQSVVITTGAFTGAVFTAQVYFQFRTLGMESGVGPVVAVALFRELGPVLTGLMVAGRVGAAMSAEIGTMRVTQQIDALRALAVNPVDYLVVPRALAMFVSMPLLALECVVCGIGASYFVARWVLGMETVYFLSNMIRFTGTSDIMMTLVKGFFFAGIVVFISCYEGFAVKKGAVGVGRATTRAVVFCSMTILVFNFFISMALNIIFPAGVR